MVSNHYIAIAPAQPEILSTKTKDDKYPQWDKY